MSALLAFQFEETPIRVVMIDGDPWWVADDLAKALDYREAWAMTRILDDDEKGVHKVHTPGGDQEMTVISEAGMYHASFKSRKEVAVRFRKWVTGELLPTLRRTGRYEMPGFEPPPAQAIDLDPTRLTAGVSVIRTAMRLYGPAAARSLWLQVGLPPVLTGGGSGPDIDPFAEPLLLWLEGRETTTIQEAAEGIGLRDVDQSTRLRIGRLLAVWGWTQRKVRRGHQTVNLFHRPGPHPSGVVIDMPAREEDL